MLEKMGVGFAAIGFSMLAYFGLYAMGFTFGLVSTLCLIPVFYKKNLMPTMGLQFFFFFANIAGLVNNF